MNFVFAFQLIFGFIIQLKVVFVFQIEHIFELQIQLCVICILNKTKQKKTKKGRPFFIHWLCNQLMLSPTRRQMLTLAKLAFVSCAQYFIQFSIFLLLSFSFASSKKLHLCVQLVYICPFRKLVMVSKRWEVVVAWVDLCLLKLVFCICFAFRFVFLCVIILYLSIKQYVFVPDDDEWLWPE